MEKRIELSARDLSDRYLESTGSSWPLELRTQKPILVEEQLFSSARLESSLLPRLHHLS